MPSFRFTDPPRVYTETRDEHDRPLGLVETGGVRDLTGPPDHRWVPADGEQEPAADGGGTADEAAPATAEPAGPVPAPPAVLPPAAI